MWHHIEQQENIKLQFKQNETQRNDKKNLSVVE